MPSELTFPSTRPGRDVPSSFAPPVVTQAAGIPRTRTLSFRLANTALNSRTSRSFGPFTGPAVLTRFQWQINTAVANPQAAIGIGVSQTSITETDVVLATAKGWRPLIERLNFDAIAVNANTEGFMQHSDPNPTSPFRGDLGIIISDPTFFIVLTIYCEGAGVRWLGDFTVVEQVSSQALANFR